MIEDAVPIRFSRRIGRKASLSAIKVVKKKTRRFGVKKRKIIVKPLLPTTKGKTKIEKKSKSEKNSKQISRVDSSLLEAKKSKPVKAVKQILSNDSSVHNAKEKFKTGQKSKSAKNFKPISKFSEQASHTLESVGCRRSRKDTTKIFGCNRKTRNSLKASQVYVSDEKKTTHKKKNHTESTVNKKQSSRQSLRVPKSSLSSEEKGKAKKLNESEVKSREKRFNRKKLSLPETSLGSMSVFFTPMTRKSVRVSGDLERKKSARLFIESSNQEISLKTSTSKLVPGAKKATRTSRHSENRKSRKPSKGRNCSSINNSEISLSASSFHSIFQTPLLSDKRKSSRLLEPSPLRTLNKELPLSAPASLLRKKTDSMLKKSSKSSKSSKLLSTGDLSKKKDRQKKLSSKKVSTNSCKKLKQNGKLQVNNVHSSEENFKMPLSNETENLPFDILTTPAFVPMHARNMSKKFLSKSDPSKRKMHVLSADANEEIHNTKKRKTSDFPNIPTKGTKKYKRWLHNNLKEKNPGYEDDIFENQNFNLYKSAFQFGDESDGSSVNIATPKFECILTPALPKKTPPFKDCISPSELMQARKTAEEYLYRRNKKRRSGDKPSSSGKKTCKNKKSTTQDIPEKKKLEEALNKLIAVKKKKKKEAEIDDEEDDTYFSDVSDEHSEEHLMCSFF